MVVYWDVPLVMYLHFACTTTPHAQHTLHIQQTQHRIITGPFHDEERQLVGLPQAWYQGDMVSEQQQHQGEGAHTPTRRQSVQQRQKEREHRRRLQERLLAFVATEEGHAA